MHSYNLESFGTDLNIAIIGASGGVGSALVQHFTSYSQVKRIYAFSRSEFPFSSDKVILGTIDLTNEDSIRSASENIGHELDIIIVASGFLHDAETMPEKSLRELSIEHLERVFAINTFGPAILAKHFISLLPKDRKSVFAALSARVGSISDNRLGGWHSYRASKAALNMLLKNTAIEIGRCYKKACIVGLHPGTVDTNLSKPFQNNVQDGKLFSPDYSAQCLVNVIDQIFSHDSGKVFAWDGQEIPS